MKKSWRKAPAWSGGFHIIFTNHLLAISFLVFKASLLYDVGSTVWVNIKEQGKVKSFQLNTTTKFLFNFIMLFSNKKKQGKKPWHYYCCYTILIYPCRLTGPHRQIGIHHLHTRHLNTLCSHPTVGFATCSVFNYFWVFSAQKLLWSSEEESLHHVL